MALSPGHLARVRELGPIFLVAVSVALFSTLAGSVFDRVHNVAADQPELPTTTATDGADGSQVLAFAGWGVSFVAPLAPELPLLRYTTADGNSVGLSSVDLEKISPVCTASRGGLGHLLRYPAGTYAAASKGDPAIHFVATINNFDYAYQSPLNECTSIPAAGEIVNRESSGIFGALDSLVAQP